MTDQPHVWVVRAGKGGKNAADFEQQGLIAIGFAPIGDVTGKNRDQLFDYARNLIGSKAGNVAGQVHRFANSIHVGDLVAVPDGQNRELLYGTVTGDYEYRNAPVIEGTQWRHVRTVKWLGRRNRDELPDRILFTLGSLLTAFEPAHQAGLAGFLLTGELPIADIDDLNGGDPSGGPDDVGGSSSTSAAEQEARNRELIAKKIVALGWSETQDFVAGVLGALGYATEVASAGADGGIDIVACRDALFLHPPVVKAQVKAKPTTKISPDEIRQLNGLVDSNSERGIFVATGGFTGPAVKEAAQMAIQLWDLDRLAELFIENYENLDDFTQGLVPLRRIWVLDEVDDFPGEA